MGLFQQRPEEPTEWAGLPSEPSRAESAAERLPSAASADLDLAALTGAPSPAVESIVIPVAPSVEIAQEQATSSGSGPSPVDPDE